MFAEEDVMVVLGIIAIGLIFSYFTTNIISIIRNEIKHRKDDKKK